jgi:phenylalanyl-tRNA synthetase alpha subunit
LRDVYRDFEDVELPEVLDFEAARQTIGNEALYIDHSELHRIDGRRILRYDLTLPLLLTAHFDGRPLRLWASGKAYRVCEADAMHLQAFHQAEAFCLDAKETLDPWDMTVRVLQSAARLFPGRALKIVPTAYPMCREAWDLEVEDHGQFLEVLAWGIFTDAIVRHLGADPQTHTAVGVGHGLERLAMIRYGIDDVRKIDVASVA